MSSNKGLFTPFGERAISKQTLFGRKGGSSMRAEDGTSPCGGWNQEGWVLLHLNILI